MDRSTNAIAAVGVGVALLLGAAAVHSFCAAFMTLGADPVLEALRRREAHRPSDIAAARGASLRAAEMFDPSRYLTNAALAAAYAPDGGNKAAGELAAWALTRQPASSHNWLRVCLARLESGKLDEARRAWLMSATTGRNLPNLLALRVDIGLRLIGPDPILVEKLADQVRLLADHDPAALRSAAERRRALPFVRVVLRREP